MTYHLSMHWYCCKKLSHSMLWLTAAWQPVRNCKTREVRSVFIDCGQVGYWKDLLEILVRACVSAEQLQKRKDLQAQTRNFMKWVCVCPHHLCALPGLCWHANLLDRHRILTCTHSKLCVWPCFSSYQQYSLRNVCKIRDRRNSAVDRC